MAMMMNNTLPNPVVLMNVIEVVNQILMIVLAYHVFLRKVFQTGTLSKVKHDNEVALDTKLDDRTCLCR